MSFSFTVQLRPRPVTDRDGLVQQRFRFYHSPSPLDFNLHEVEQSGLWVSVGGKKSTTDTRERSDFQITELHHQAFCIRIVIFSCSGSYFGHAISHLAHPWPHGCKKWPGLFRYYKRFGNERKLLNTNEREIAKGAFPQVLVWCFNVSLSAALTEDCLSESDLSVWALNKVDRDPGSWGLATHVKLPSVLAKRQGKYRLPLGWPAQLPVSVLVQGSDPTQP